MSGKERIHLYVSEDVKEKFDKAVAEHFGQTDGFRSEAAELALREWADRDRDARIEEKLDRVLDELGADASEEPLEREKDKSNDEDGSGQKGWPTGRVGNSLTAIEHDLPSSGTVSEDDIETAIEEHGGTAYKTVRKYWKLVEKHKVAMPIPDSSDEYAADQRALAMACETRDDVTAADVRSVVDEHADDFGADLEFSEEWYLNALDENFAKYNRLKFAQAPDLDDTDWRLEKFDEQDPLGETDESKEPESTGSDDSTNSSQQLSPDDVAGEMSALENAMTDGGGDE